MRGSAVSIGTEQNIHLYINVTQIKSKKLLEVNTDSKRGFTLKK